jgi:hypothetical protein
MPSPLLLLPGELRNEIYRYVLSEADGLDFVLEHYGPAWLCIHGNSMAIEDGHNLSDEDCRDETAVPPSSPILYTVNGGRVIANQLQFVCRQLRKETKNLGISYNTIRFSGPTSSTVSTFMQDLPTRLRHQPHNFVLEAPYTNWKHEIFSKLLKVCQTYSWCTFHYRHLRIKSSEPLSMLMITYVVKQGARNDKTFVKQLSNNVSVQQRLLRLADTETSAQQVASIPQNLRFHPHDNEFDEHAFRAACLKNRAIQRVLIPSLDNGVDDLVAVAKDVYANGF